MPRGIEEYEMNRESNLSPKQIAGTAHFTWMFSEIFFLELEDGECAIWLSRMYPQGDGSLMLTEHTYESYCKSFNIRGRDKGEHCILDYLSRE